MVRVINRVLCIVGGMVTIGFILTIIDDMVYEHNFKKQAKNRYIPENRDYESCEVYLGD